MIIHIIKASAITPVPDYIVDGVTQSHWLAENSVTSGEIVTSVIDVSGTEDLIQYSTGATYEATGWGGDSGPSIYINNSKLSANGWASRVSGIRTPFTMTAKVQILTSGVYYNTPWGFSYNNTYPLHLGPRALTTSVEIFRSYSSGGTSYWTYKTGTPAQNLNRHNWYIEYDGSNHRMWIDGVEMAYITNYSNVLNYNYIFNQFYVGNWGTASAVAPVTMRFAEIHIYLTSAFDAAQRTILINDLQNRRGT